MAIEPLRKIQELVNDESTRWVKGEEIFTAFREFVHRSDVGTREFGLRLSSTGGTMDGNIRIDTALNVDGGNITTEISLAVVSGTQTVLAYRDLWYQFTLTGATAPVNIMLVV